MFNLFRYPILYLSACAFFFFFDRLGKFVAQSGSGADRALNSVLAFGYYPNQGIGFGIQMNKTIIVVASIIIILVLAGWLVHVLKKEYVMQAWGISFIIFGAINNLIDRVFFGQVIDYIKLFDWSLFNLADAMIICGLILVLLGWQRSEAAHFTNK